MQIINRGKLVGLVYKRLNGTIPKIVINDVISIIIDRFTDDMLDNKTFSIYNFGTFSPCTDDGHIGFNISTRLMQFVKPYRRIRFAAHFVFVEKINQRLNKFKKG